MDPRDYPEKVRKSKAPPSAHHAKRAGGGVKEAYLSDLEAAVCEAIIVEGLTRRETSEKFGISIARVQHYWVCGHKRAAEANIPRVEEQVEKLNAALDLDEEDLRELIGKYRDTALTGDPDAAHVVIKATQALTAKYVVRMRANGLEAPTKHELTGGVTVTLTDIEEALRASRSNVIDVQFEPAAIDSAGPGRSLQ